MRGRRRDAGEAAASRPRRGGGGPPLSRDQDALLDILEAIALIREHAPAAEEALREDVVRQAAVLRWIHIVGEAANRVSPELRQAHPEVPWRRVVDMRNLIAHAYDVVRLDIVWQAIQRDLPELEGHVSAILAELG